MKLIEKVALYRQADSKTTGTDTVTFVGAKVKRGQILELTHLSVLDLTSLQKELRLGWRNGKGDDHWIEKWVSSAQSRQYGAHTTGRLLLVEDESPIAQVVSPSDGDVVYWSAFGYIHEVTE